MSFFTTGKALDFPPSVIIVIIIIIIISSLDKSSLILSATIGTIATQQAHATEATMEAVVRLLN